jgi:DegV family protein with EDD domain
MDKVVIVTDTIACLTKEMVEQYGIKVVPINIFFEGKMYREGIDITPAEGYRLLEKAPEQFTTSTPSPGEYLELYHELSARAESILCITLSSKFSTLYNVAQIAKEQAKEELPQTTIEVLDSKTATVGEGLIVLAAAQAAAKGKDLAEVIEAAEKVKEKVDVIAFMETIRHAYRTGRIPKVASQIGSMFRIKPIVTISEGAVHFISVVRTKRQGVEQIIQIMRGKVGLNPLHMAVAHAAVPEEGERLKQQISSEFNCVEAWLTEFSPVMGYATGRGTLAVGFYPEV